MSDDSKSLNIEIRTNVELAGAERVARSIEMQIGAARALGKETTELEKKHTQLVAAINQYTTKQKAAAEATHELTDAEAGVIRVSKEHVDSIIKQTEESKKLEGMHNKVHAALRTLGAAFPEIGHLGHFLTDPITIGLGMGMIIIDRVKEGIKQLQETLSKTSAWKDMKDAVDAAKDSLRDAKIEAADFEDELGRLARAQQNASEKSAEFLKIHAASVGADDKVREARYALEKKVIEAGEKDPVRKAEKMLGLEEKYAALRKRSADDEAKFQISQKERTLSKEEEDNLAYDSPLAAARKKRDAMQSETFIKAKLATDKGNIDESEKTIKELQGRADEIERGWGGRLTRSNPTQWELDVLKGIQIPGEVNNLTSLKGFYQKESNQAPKNISKFRAADAEVKRLEDLQKSGVERVTSLRREIETMKAVEAENARGREGSAYLESKGRRVDAASADKDSQLGQNIIRAGQIVRSHVGANGMISGTPEEMAFLVQMVNAYSGHPGGGGRPQDAVRIFSGADTNASTHSSIFGRMQAVSDVQHDQGTARAVEHGQQVSEADKQTLIKHASDYAGVAVTLQQATAIMDKAADTPKVLEALIAILRKIVEGQEQLWKSMSDHSSRIQDSFNG